MPIFCLRKKRRVDRDVQVQPDKPLMHLHQLNNKLTLVSQSETRRTILERMGISATFLVSKIPERSEKENIRDYVQEIATKKLRSVADEITTPYALSADTIVCVGPRILGKPKNISEAVDMLDLLNGSTQRIYTAVTIYCAKTNTWLEGIDSATVEFRSLSAEEITSYIALNDWKNAAGAYKIQSDGISLIRSVAGAPSTVAGLPVHLIDDILGRYLCTNKISHL